MARFRKKMKFRTRTVYKQAKRRSKSHSSMTSDLMLIGSAMVYGGVREKLSNALEPVTKAVPLGNVADEVVLGVAGYFAYKKGSGIVKELGKAALIIESARLGEAIINGQVNMGQSTSSVKSEYVYG